MQVSFAVSSWVSFLHFQTSSRDLYFLLRHDLALPSAISQISVQWASYNSSEALCARLAAKKQTTKAPKVLFLLLFFPNVFELQLHWWSAKSERITTAPKSSLHKFAKISTKHHYNTRLSTKECFPVDFSRTKKKWKHLSLELVWLFGILFHILLKLTPYLIFLSLLLNTIDNEENYFNVTYLIEYFKKLIWYVLYTSMVILVFFF